MSKTKRRVYNASVLRYTIIFYVYIQRLMYKSIDCVYIYNVIQENSIYIINDIYKRV